MLLIIVLPAAPLPWLRNQIPIEAAIPSSPLGYGRSQASRNANPSVICLWRTTHPGPPSNRDGQMAPLPAQAPRFGGRRFLAKLDAATPLRCCGVFVCVALKGFRHSPSRSYTQLRQSLDELNRLPPCNACDEKRVFAHCRTVAHALPEHCTVPKLVFNFNPGPRA